MLFVLGSALLSASYPRTNHAKLFHARRRTVDGSILGKDPHGCMVGGVHGASQCITCLGVLVRVPRVVALPPNTMGTNGLFFILAFFGRQKIGSASALSGFPLRFSNKRRQHKQSLMITPPPTDAIGDSSLLFVLAFLGRQKISSASALS